MKETIVLVIDYQHPRIVLSDRNRCDKIFMINTLFEGNKPLDVFD